MTKVLELKFALSNNSSLTITLQKPKGDLTDAQINAAMNSIVASNCISRDGVTIVAKKQARFVERQVTEVTVS